MQINKPVRSLKYPLFYLHILLTCGFALLILTSLIYTFIYQSQQNTKMAVNEWANIVHENAVQAISQQVNKTDLLNSILFNFEKVSRVNYIYVYKKEPQGLSLIYYHNKTPLFTSSFPNSTQISFLSSPQVVNGNIEYIKPILSNDESIVGYIHIQAASNITSELIKKFSIISFLLFIFVLSTSVLVMCHYYKTIIKQVNSVVQTVQNIAKYKNYRTSFERANYKEIDQLSNVLNIMLARIDKDLSASEKTKQEIFHLNSDLENRITSRTEALKDSNKELLSTLEKLHQFQGQLVENEKMASLGDMVAGVAHEINTPIGLGVTASSVLEDKLHEIQQAYDDKTLKGSQLKQFLNESEKHITIVRRNLNRAAQLISSFKQVAVDQSNEEPRRVNVKELINEICLTLAPQLSHTNYNITISCDPELDVNIKAGPMNQILINLIMNSKIHGFNNFTEGNITITVMNLSNQLNIIYQDDGVGIDDTIKSKIFEPFITTKRGEGGSGLGLHLVYNLVTQALGGSIELDNSQSKGVVFEINVPI